MNTERQQSPREALSERTCQALSVWARSRREYFERVRCRNIPATGELRLASASDVWDPMTDVFAVMCRVGTSGSGLETHGWIYGHRQPLGRIWDEPARAAREAGREPFIVCKEAHRAPIVLLTRTGLELLQAAARSTVPLYAAIVRSPVSAHIVMWQDVITRVVHERLFDITENRRR